MRDRQRRIAEQITIDEQMEIVTIFGTRFTAELFETLTSPTPKGYWFRLTRTDDGVVTVHVRTDLIEPMR